jgi:cell division protein FtsW
MSELVERKNGHIDWLILLPVVFLMLFSIAFVYSASATIASFKFGSSESLFIKHTIRIALGIITILIFSRIDYHFWQKYSKVILISAVIFLFIVLFSKGINDVTRWITIGPVSFQPTEFAKFAMVLHFATLLTRKQDVIKTLQFGLMPFLFWMILLCYLIAMQPNFSNAAVIYIIGLIMLYIGNANFFHLLLIAGSSIAVASLYITSTTNYRLDRILSYIGDITNSSLDHKMNYQLHQALIALGNGGVFGVGPGQSRQSHLFLPESYGDFIYAIIGEEYGFMGAFIILILFIFIFFRGIKTAKNAPDLFGYYLASGILITFAIYVVVNAGVNSGLLPTTGLPMPFVSYGGTAVLIYSAAIGILLNISAQAGTYPQENN